MKHLIKLSGLVAAMLLSLCTAPSAVAAVPHFSWGADVGGAIDMTTNNMSSINIDVYFGYRSSFIDMAGIGVGLNTMVNTSLRTYPVYGILRTSFTSRPSLAFMDMRAGCSFNSESKGDSHPSFFISPGVGFHLARSQNFRSYIILSYVFNDLRSYSVDSREYDFSAGLHFACLRIGVSF
ncbi:MAG: hypothetical protein HDS08_02510 [Bacteroides sp.]|nr:hypothetical protein [Barnesiella sp.]MBD5315018.1 hypothetical protein [Bacteroides sp.]MDE7449906.1 hypothetical protein [Paramuribaculum sp.]